MHNREMSSSVLSLFVRFFHIFTFLTNHVFSMYFPLIFTPNFIFFKLLRYVCVRFDLLMTVLYAP